MKSSSKSKRRKGGGQSETTSPIKQQSQSAPNGTATGAAESYVHPKVYTLIAKDVPSDMLPGLLSVNLDMLGALAVRQRYLKGVPCSDAFLDFAQPPSRAAGGEPPLLARLRSFFPVYPFNYCPTCLSKYHSGPCPAIPPDAQLPPPPVMTSSPSPSGSTSAKAAPIGKNENDDDDLPPLIDGDEVEENGDDLPPLLEGSDVSSDEGPPAPTAKAAAASSKKRNAKKNGPNGPSRSPPASLAGEEEGNYYDDYRYNPPLVFEQSIHFITGQVPAYRDFGRHRAAILSFLMSHNVDVSQINEVQPTTTGFKVLFASTFAFRGFGNQPEYFVPTLGKVKVEIFNGYRRDAKPGWHDAGSEDDDDFTDEDDDYEEVEVHPPPKVAQSKRTAVEKDDDDLPPLMDDSSDDDDNMPPLMDDSSDDDDNDDEIDRRRPVKSTAKAPRAVIVNKIREEREQRRQFEAQQKKLESARKQSRARRQQLAERRRADEAEQAAIRFDDLLSGVERRKAWPCARSACKNPVIFHYEKRVKAKCEKGCIAQYHKSCWQDAVTEAQQEQHRSTRNQTICPKCGARVNWHSLRINFGERKRILADEAIEPIAPTATTATATEKSEQENESEHRPSSSSSEDRKKDWLAASKRQEEEIKRRRDEAERKKREQEDQAKREDEDRRAKRRQERRQRKKERERGKGPQLDEAVVVAKAGERAQPKPKPAVQPPVDPTTLIQATPDKIHVKKAEKDELPESAKQDLERRKQRNAKKKQKRLEKLAAKDALRIDLSTPPPSASSEERTLPIPAQTAAEWPAEALRLAQSEGWHLPDPSSQPQPHPQPVAATAHQAREGQVTGYAGLPIINPVTGEVVNRAALVAPPEEEEEEDIWAMPEGETGLH